MTRGSIKHHQMELPEHITHARHALAIHELREKFEPELWWRTFPGNSEQTLKQVWFAGSHSDVGGGYENRAWSDLALTWMQKEARMVGFKISKRRPYTLTKNISAAINQENWLPLCPPIPRSVLGNVRSVPSETLRTFEMHSSVCRRWHDKVAMKYDSSNNPIHHFLNRFQKKAVQKFYKDKPKNSLREVDELSLKLYLTICFRDDPVASAARTSEVSGSAKDWWADVKIAEVVGAEDVIKDFMALTTTPKKEAIEPFGRAFRLQLLCNGICQRNNLLKRVEEITQIGLKSLRNSPPDFGPIKSWQPVLNAVANEVVKSISQLPEPWKGRAKRAAAILQNQTVAIHFAILRTRRATITLTRSRRDKGSITEKPSD
jgi:hypothetical protein